MLKNTLHIMAAFISAFFVGDVMDASPGRRHPYRSAIKGDRLLIEKHTGDIHHEQDYNNWY